MKTKNLITVLAVLLLHSWVTLFASYYHNYKIQKQFDTSIKMTKECLQLTK